MMKSKRITMACLSALFCVSLSGCLALSFGGKYSHNDGINSKELEGRIAQLESRINTLEHYAGILPKPTEALVSHQYDDGYGGPCPSR